MGLAADRRRESEAVTVVVAAGRSGGRDLPCSRGSNSRLSATGPRGVLDASDARPTVVQQRRATIVATAGDIEQLAAASAAHGAPDLASWEWRRRGPNTGRRSRPSRRGGARERRGDRRGLHGRRGAHPAREVGRPPRTVRTPGRARALRPRRGGVGVRGRAILPSRPFRYFAGWVAVATSAACVHGFTRTAASSAVTVTPPGDPTSDGNAGC